MDTFAILLLRFISFVITIYIWLIIIRAVVSWFRPDPYHPLMRLLYRLTEPILEKVRRVIPVSAGGFDFSPIIVLILLYILKSLISRTLSDILWRLH
ncbi:YggT family protein [bacterium]|nr:YggT family protein [bacterium]